MAIVGNLANNVKTSMANSQAAVSTNFAAQRAQTQTEFDAKALAEDTDFQSWLDARDAESLRRIAEINDAGTGVKDVKLAEVAAIFGDVNGSLENTDTIMNAYRLFLANDSSADASLTAAYNAEAADIAAYRTELGIDDEDAILALV